MTTPIVASTPTEIPAEPNAVAAGVSGPMPQQAASGSHGYEIHLQEFVRLVGCHQSKATTDDVVLPLQRTAA
jgi:hypothetical protein